MEYQQCKAPDCGINHTASSGGHHHHH
jgi:cobalt-zinc-cadmium efflux system protein